MKWVARGSGEVVAGPAAGTAWRVWEEGEVSCLEGKYGAGFAFPAKYLLSSRVAAGWRSGLVVVCGDVRVVWW